jgi:hypothetical protein
MVVLGSANRTTEEGTMTSLASIAIGIVVVVFLIARQMMKRSVREDRKPVIMLILFVIGLYETAQYVQSHSVSGTAIAMAAASIVLAAVFGVIRGYTVRLWREGGTLWRQGTPLTLLLWVVSMGVHFGADYLAGGGSVSQGLTSATLLLYIAVTFGLQQLITQTRAARIPVNV